MKIIFYEMRKSWLKTITFIVLMILTALNFLRMNDLCRIEYPMTYGERGKWYYNLYGTVCGDLNEEKLESFRTQAKALENEVADMSYSTEYQPDKYYTGYVWGDYNLYNFDVGSEITYCITYPKESSKILDNAAENFNFYRSVGNYYEAKREFMVYNSYQGRNIPEYRATYWSKLFFNHEFSSLLCIVMLIFGGASSFSIEKESGMYQLITAAGRKGKTTTSKIISSAVYCAFLSIWFTVFDLLFSNILLGVRGLDMPLYSAPMFQQTPFTFSLLSGVLLWMGVRFLALFAVSLLILLISKITPNTIIAMAVSFGASLLLIMLTSFTKSVWNPICALNPNVYISDFTVVNVFGEPVLLLFAALVAITVECAALIGSMFVCDRVKGV